MPHSKDFSWVTTDQFDAKLGEIMDRDFEPSNLLGIPGIYEIMSEHLNNEVLGELEQEKQAADEAREGDDHNNAKLPQAEG